MNKFSNIANPLPKAEEKPKVKKPVHTSDNFEIRQAQEKAAAKEAEAKAASELDDVNVLDGGAEMDVDAFTQFMGSEREIPEIEEDLPPVDEIEQERVDADESWFKRHFGGKDDSPVSEEGDAELDDEMYAATGQIGSEITDTVLPSLINSMHGTEDVKEYQASEDQKRGLARAWGLYMRSIKRKVSPLTYLIGKIAIVYGAKFISGLFMYLSRLREIGLHWPWSNGWKKQYKYVSANPTDAEVAEQLQDIADNLEKKVENNEQSQSKPVPKEPPPKPELVKRESESEMTKQDLLDGSSFETGAGFPRTSKTSPEFIDAFATYKNYMTYVNKNGLRNRKKK